MRQVKLYIACSIDGKIAGIDGNVDWLPHPPEGEDYGYYSFYDSIDELAMGYKTYEICISLGDWPYKGKPTHVFTRDSSKSVVKDASLVTSDIVQFTKELKAKEGGDIWLVGGGNIIQQLHDADLIDEYIISYVPVILGAGIELFPNLKKVKKLQLIHHKVYADGLSLMHYKKG